MKYRADIDGLRTIAVVPVVIYHAGLPFFSGGFVGVDVFFVLSGYLITSIILNEIKATNSFDFANFYLRRIRRLLPAMIPVVGFSIILAWKFFIPQDFEQFMQSVLGVFTFTANFTFLSQADYFAEASATKPLLHFWSLAVEEQFYLITPALLLIFWRVKSSSIGTFLSLFFAISFFAALIVMNFDMQEQAFFNSLFRFWELLVGSLLAYFHFRGVPLSGGSVMRGIGLALIVYAVIIFNHDTSFPGLTAVIPVFGTALVISAGLKSKDVFLTLLESKVFVYVGKISYGFYLWHWPIIVAAGFVSDGSYLISIVSIFVSFSMASLSFHILESPLRHGKFLKYKIAGFSFFAITTASALGFVGITNKMDWATSRLDTDMSNITALLDTERAKKQWIWSNEECETRIPNLKRNLASCLDIRADMRNILLIGDSHAQHLLPGFESVLQEDNIIGIMAGGCKPLLDWRPERASCDIWRNYLFEGFDSWNDIDTVVISMRQNAESVEKLKDTLTALRGRGAKNIYVIGPNIELEPSFDKIVAKNLSQSSDFISDVARGSITEKSAELNDRVKSIAKDSRVTYIDSQAIICENMCTFFDPSGNPIILDYGHFTPEGSKWFVEKLVQNEKQLGN